MRANVPRQSVNCVLDDVYDEWLDESGLSLENQEGSGDGADRRNVLGHIYRMKFCPPAEEGLIFEKKFMPRYLENRCATML